MNLFGGSGPSPAEIQRECAVKAQITSNLKQAVQILQKTHINSDEPIHSKDTANAVCSVLEAIFLHGLKSPVSKKSFWSLLQKVTHKDTVLQLTHLPQISTDVGLCRAWIRMALNDGVLESYLNAILDDKKILRNFYKRTAYLRDLEHPGIMLTYIQSMNLFQFELSHNSSMLNIWTQTPLVLAGLMAGQSDPRPVIARPTPGAHSFPSPRTTTAVTHTSPDWAAASRAQQTRHKKAKVNTRHVHTIGYSHLAGDPTTPPNTPADPSALTQRDIDVIRSMTRNSDSDTSSTGTSQISHPDPVDARQLEPNLPELRIFSGVQPRADQPEQTTRPESEHTDTSTQNHIPLNNGQPHVDIYHGIRNQHTKQTVSNIGNGEGNVNMCRPSEDTALLSNSVHDKPEPVPQSMQDVSALNPFEQEYDNSLNPFMDDDVSGDVVCDTAESSGLCEKVSPALSDEVSPVLSDKVSPVLSDKVSPVPSDRVSPVLSDKVSPVLSDKVSPVLSDNAVSSDVQDIIHDTSEQSNSADPRPPQPQPDEGSNQDKLSSNNVNGPKAKSSKKLTNSKQDFKPIKQVSLFNSASKSHKRTLSDLQKTTVEIVSDNSPGTESRISSLFPVLQAAHSDSVEPTQPTSQTPDDTCDIYASAAADDQTPESGLSSTENPSLTQDVADVSRDSITTSLTNSSSFPKLDLGKSPPLQPELSSAVATCSSVEVAKEAISGLSSSHTDTVSSALEESGGLPRGNSLGYMGGYMGGWSSDFETSVRSDVDDGSFSLSNNYTSSLRRSAVEDMIQGDTVLATEALLADVRDGQTVTTERPTSLNIHPHLAHVPQERSLDDEEMMREYEVLPDLMEKRAYLAQPKYEPLIEMLGTLNTERGLDIQNYQCNGCTRPVGMFYGKARVCGYDACYYCYECHQNDEAYIPARIIYNWDFRKQKVCRENFEFLYQSEDDPMLRLNTLNPKLYSHVPEMDEIKNLRTQLRYLRTYLFTCKQSVADSLRKQVWPKEYYYDDIHLYSLSDLLQVATGQLAVTLSRVVKFGSKHVYDCALCGQKGFVCELCNDSKVIYPFEMESTVRCERCSSVYHKDCKTPLRRCPKCERRLKRRSQQGSEALTPDSLSDYSFSPQPHVIAGIV